MEEKPDTHELQDKLMGILLQTTRDAAGKLVRSFVDEGKSECHKV